MFPVLISHSRPDTDPADRDGVPKGTSWGAAAVMVARLEGRSPPDGGWAIDAPGPPLSWWPEIRPNPGGVNEPLKANRKDLHPSMPPQDAGAK